MEDNQIRKELNSIEIPEELNERIMNGFIQAEKEMSEPSLKKKINLKKKFLLWFSAAVIFIGLFIGSTFVSPAMATIASKIPLFNKVFKRGPIGDTLLEYLIEQGFEIKGQSQSRNKISIAIDPKQYSNQKKEVKQTAEQYLQQQGYDNIEIKIEKYDGYKIAKDIREYPIENRDFIFEIFTKMEEAGFNTSYNSYVAKPDPAELTLVIPETDYETRKNEIISIVKKAGNTFDVGEYKLSFETFTFDERERSERWANIISTLDEVLLNQEEYSIRSFGSSVKDDVTLYVQLDIPAKNSKSRGIAKAIEQEIHEFLSSKEINKTIKDDHYQIEITSKNEKKLN